MTSLFSSTSPDYPSLSHVSGDINIGKKQGTLNLVLKDSVFLYDKLFLIPYEFKNLKVRLIGIFHHKINLA